MRIKLLLVVWLLTCGLGFGQTDLIISQYIETNLGTTPKGIEIFNVSGASINFAVNNLEIFQGTNGATCNSLISITSGTLAADEVWVIGTSDLTAYAITNGTDLSGTTDYTFVFNGDDALRVELGGIVQDMFGICGTDPGAAWTGGGVSTANNNLQIQNGICDGDTDGWTNPSSRFDQIANGTTMTGFGNAPVSCSTTNTTVQFTSTTSTLAEDGLFIDICASISNPSITNATTVDISLDGASTATNGADYDDGAGIPAAIVFPQTLTFPANSSTNQCLTIFISNDDLLIEGDETVVLSLTNPTGGDAAALGINTQHVLTITDNDAAFPADVVITEIMYNTSGTDDEWIEICNVSGSTQVLNGYSIEVGGVTEFTFPLTGVLIANGNCITIALGDSGDATFNPDCPFTPDYTNGSGTGTLNNTSDTINLIASDTSTVIDTVSYNSSDGGNTDSLHVIDISLNNDTTSSNYWEVINGGSPGVNSLISPCTPIGPEINVEGTTANFPNIANGDVTPIAFDGTDFGNVPVFGTSTNTFRIENFGGTQNLTITSVTVVSGDIGDFSISALPSTPITPANPNGFSNFDVEFSPTTIGPKTAVIQIISNDTDENPYTFTVAGNAECVANAITASPNSGPINTIVTVTGTNLSTATASFNGLAAAVSNISATIMEVTVPAGAISGNLEIIDDLGCPGSVPFTIINSQISSCEGSSGTIPTDLFISEVTDANTGGLTYIEIYNGTGVTVNLDNYNVQFFNNGNATENGGFVDLNNVNLASGNTYVVGVSSGSNCTGITGGDGSLANQTGFGGVNFVVNGDDHIRLYNGTTHIDSWGAYLSNNWADTLGIGSEGAVFTRNNTAGSLPNTIFNLADWSYVDWVSCADNDYSNIGSYDFSLGIPPSVAAPVITSTNCLEATITVTAAEGFVGGNSLTYQWFSSAPGDTNWTALTNDAVYSGVTTNTLTINNTFNLNNYQYYCEVRENTATCAQASDAVRINIEQTTWDGSSWSNGVPTAGMVAILDANYTTSVPTPSFTACNLIVNAELNVTDNYYIEVINDALINSGGNIIVETRGAFVQRNDAGSFTLNGGNASLNKDTALKQNWYDYTYWSSPVVNETVENVFPLVPSNRRFYFEAQNFVDIDGNDIDDNANDWQIASGILSPGTGYAATSFNIGPFPRVDQNNFIGAFNNGIIPVPVYRNATNPVSSNNWNFIGNPYPSAIDFVELHNQNSGVIEGAAYLWSQASPPLESNPGNENLNFSQNDYAIINVGSGNVAGGASGGPPSNFIGSAQGFFVNAIGNGTVTFNNSMRETSNNTQFFRAPNVIQPDKLWLNLTSDNGVFNQLLVAYVDGATNADDGMYYDAPRNQATGTFASLYSTVENSDKPFAIQGKDPNSLSLNEVIPLGFNNSISAPTVFTISIAQLQGDFMNNNSIYLKDNLLNLTHDLSQSDYNFTAEVGQFNQRFEIVFNRETLSIGDENLTADGLAIIELPNGDVQFIVSQQHQIKEVTIVDLMGRVVYQLKGNHNTETYNLSQLSKAAYIAKVTLANGQTLYKKAVKRF